MIDDQLAVIFPGQASQHIGMLSDLSVNYKLIKEIFSEVSEVLGYDIWKLIQLGPSQKLNETRYAQPAILTVSVAIWKIWKLQEGRTPNIMAGHSLGEYSALVCAESIDLLSAVKLVSIRGTLMQKAVPHGYGAMSAIIGLDDNIVIELCKQAKNDQIIAPSGFNAPGYVVVSGHTEAVNRLNLLCKNAGAKYVSILPISVPSHCMLMYPIIEKFQEELKKVTIYPPKVSVINNVDTCIEKNPNVIRNALLRQLYTPVYWNNIIQYCINNNINKFIEMGPNQILTKLIKRTINNVYSFAINDSYSLSQSIKIC